MARIGLIAIAVGLAGPVAAQQVGTDQRLVERPASHEGQVRTVDEMQCIRAAADLVLCNKAIGDNVLTVMAGRVDIASHKAADALLGAACSRPADLGEMRCSFKASFEIRKSEVESLRLRTGGPLVRRVKLTTPAVILTPPGR